MCGIVGFLGASAIDDPEAVIARMAQAIAHRGPDDQQAWLDRQAGLALGFRRLAILDLSINGRQPMQSRSGRYVLLHNGEIYNHRALRDRLPGPWRGTSDTESMLAAIDAWGVAATLEALDGMFGLAVWDRETRCLILARDRFGEKPLYYGWPKRCVGRAPLLFGSELKALAAFPGWDWAVDPRALSQFLRYGYVPGPLSIIEGIYKLPPGHLIEIAWDAPAEDPTPRPYWDKERIFLGARSRVAQASHGPDADAAITDLGRVLETAVGSRLESDVPLGAFLSGGIDSSLIVALMRRHGDVRSFTIGFEDPRFDESPHAEAVAAHLGTRHETAMVTDGEVLDIVPRLPTIYDEPFADVSQLPTTLLAMLTKRAVTVALSGDGGDELFGGYPRYKSIAEGWERITAVPQGLRALSRGLAGCVPRHTLNAGLGGLGQLRGRRARRSRPGDRLQRRLAALGAPGLGSYARQRAGRWADPQDLVAADMAGGADPYLAGDRLPQDIDPFAAAMYLDAGAYLPDDLLTKVDRASMSVALEVRAPMLDPAVAAFAWSLPRDMMWRDGEGKWLLRQLLYRFVPRHVIDRPKQGFEPPVGTWLRGTLREWAEELLRPEHLCAIGLTDPRPVQACWREHVAGQRDWRFHLWNVLMFASWSTAWRAESASVTGEQG